jgi:hypothetical protein
MIHLRRFILTLITLFTLFVASSLTILANTIPLSAVESNLLSKWTSKGIILGYPDGSFKLNQSMTRGEFSAIICRIFGFTALEAPVLLSDVPQSKWSASAIHQIVFRNLMEVYSSDSNLTFRPDTFITHHEAATALSRIYQTELSNLLKYLYLNPDTPLSRLECLMLIDKLTTDLINSPSTYTHTVDGNLIINSPNVLLKDLTITGNLYLAEGIGDGTIVLDNVHVKGTVYVNGCGENSLLLSNKTSVAYMIVDNKINTVRLTVDSSDTIQKLVLLSPTILDGPITLFDPSSIQYALYQPTITPDSPTQPISDSNSSPSKPIVTDPIVDTPPSNPDPPIPPPSTPIPNIPDFPEAPDDDYPVTTGPALVLDTPSNIYIDFNDYPLLTLYWDKVALADSYQVELLDLNNINCSYSKQTTDSVITLDTLLYPLAADNDYSISITAVSGDITSHTTQTLNLNFLVLEEHNNGTLWASTNASSLDSIIVHNLHLGVYELSNDSDEFFTPTPLYIFEFDTRLSSYLIPRMIKNDSTYILKILNASLADHTAPIINSYTASYFANTTYEKAIDSTLAIGLSETDPIILSSSRHLNNLSTFVSEGQTTLGKYFKLLNDIDFSRPITGGLIPSDAFIPIGIKEDGPTPSRDINPKPPNNKLFEGDFDGNYCTIYNLNISMNNPSTSPKSPYIYAGLFAATTGSIKNLTLDAGCSISVTSYRNIAGGIAAYCDYKDSSKSISNCYNSASIYGSWYAGGVIGYIFSHDNSSNLVVDCYNYGSVRSTYSAGGVINTLNILDNSELQVLNCHNYGSIRAVAFSGGIISESRGASKSTISYCSNFGSITTQKDDVIPYSIGAGGIIGSGTNPILLNDCLNGGAVTCNGKVTPQLHYSPPSAYTYAGGIIGYTTTLNLSLLNNYNCAPVSSTLLGKGARYSGSMLASAKPSYIINHCYTLASINISPPGLPDSSSAVLSVPYATFINRIEQFLPHLADDIKACIFVAT